MRAKGIVLIIASLIILTSIGCAYHESYLWKISSITAPFKALQKIPQGTILDDLELGELRPEQAQTEIKNWAEDKLEQTLLLVYNGKEIKASPQELGISLDFDKTWSDIENNQGKKVESTLKIDKVSFRQILEEEFAKYGVEPVNAKFVIVDNEFIITPETPGQAVSVDSALAMLKDSSLYNIPKEIPIKFEEVPAEITSKKLEQLAFNGVVSEYTTYFNENDINRTTNLKAAASALDETLLKPGEIFSFNETVGPRTEEAGYKDAYIIFNNEYIQGIGGGICQVSSTLYSAAVLANLSVVERAPHAVAVSYMPAGQDATVYYPELDLKICNDTDSYVYIRSMVNHGSLTIRLYGKKTDVKVRFEQEIEEEIDYETIYKLDPSLRPGTIEQDQHGSKGYVVSTWKIVTDKAGIESKEFLSRDEYAPANKIIRFGAD